MDQAALSQTASGAAARAALGAILALLAGCASQAGPTGPLDDDLVRAMPVAEKTEISPPPTAGELVPPDDRDVQAAMRAWKSGRSAPIIRTTEFIQYPYGLTEAIVTCEPLRVCDVELDVGEEIQNVSIGDSSRWLVHPAFSGARESLTPHVMIKPTEYGIVTNAIITTNRRTYYLGLVSKAKGDPGYVRRVKFYYPLDLVEQTNGTFRAKAALSRRAPDPTVARGPRLAPDRLAFGYEIVGGQGLPWRPLRVFDDGQHVYIQMPAALQASEAPALLVQSRGESALVNYRVRLPYYVVDRLFDTAVLIVGVGSKQDRVTIRRKADGQ
ncbi:MAG TPA: P-type conjugative transfer protein TrbG [Candidatus Polarisedimenticolia bacterium]|nr:P-type conjugative transfer protein TrbG [Candidatus Polarisedimenticolia bacterium]